MEVAIQQSCCIKYILDTLKIRVSKINTFNGLILNYKLRQRIKCWENRNYKAQRCPSMGAQSQ